MNRPPIVSNLLEQAHAAMARGNLKDAEWLCRMALEADPESAKAHGLRGIVATCDRRPADAIRHLTRSHELNPRLFDVALCLVSTNRMLGDRATAIHFAEVAVELRPNDRFARVELGTAYLEASRLSDAEEHLRAAVRLSPQDPGPYLALNRCLESLGKRAESQDVIRQLLDRRLVPPSELLKLTATLLREGSTNAAVECSRAALAVLPGSLRARVQLARSLIEANRGEEAAAVLDAPGLDDELSRETRDGDIVGVLGTVYRALGRIAEAQASFRRAMVMPDGVGLAFYGYTHSSRLGEDDRPLVEAMEARLADPKANPADRSYLHFGLGKAFEDFGDYDRAMEHYELANLAERVANSENAPLDRSRYAEMIDQIIATFSPEMLRENAGFGPPSETPILIVGPIRSGTTLAEQILSSHPQIGGAGEVPFWVANGPDLADPARGVLHLDRIRAAADRYVDLLESDHPGRARVVDKLPGNYQMLGLIRLGLPNARIIHMRRAPVDTALSIYTTHNRAVSEFGHDRGNIAFGLRQYQRLMAHWRAVLPPDRFLDVDYEDLVSNTEAAVRRMVEFCGLEWDDACLRPQANPRAVSTPSAWQVRQPVYTTSVERWRRFQPYLGEFSKLI